MKKILRTKKETIEYFKQLAFEYEKQSYRNDDPTVQAMAQVKSEAYKLVAFEIENNME